MVRMLHISECFGSSSLLMIWNLLRLVQAHLIIQFAFSVCVKDSWNSLTIYVLCYISETDELEPGD